MSKVVTLLDHESAHAKTAAVLEKRFHGVATHYLPNYPGWRWAVDADRIASPVTMLRAAIGVFPHLPVT